MGDTEHTETTTIGTTPLAAFLDGEQRRATFSVKARPRVELPEVEGVLAGAAEVDITPPPGMPKAGYSANAHDGNGFRTRLRARVTHLRAGRSSIAIVQCDLLAGSSVIQYLVAQAIAERTDIPHAGLWIGATHTHAGPGQFLGTDFYNHHASNRAGFDPAFTDFLVRRIASAVIEAHDSRGPAQAAVGDTEVWGLTRNRSHDPYVQNRTVTDKRMDPQRKWVAVNPLLHMIRVDRLTESGTEPLSAAVMFAIHGTGVSQHAHEYNADVWAYLVGELKHQIVRRHDARPIVGASEGTHADVAPALRPGCAGHPEARRVGRGIGLEAADLYDRLGHELSSELQLDAGLREVDLDKAKNRRIDDIEIPDRPAVGAALVAGAAENLTPVIHRIPPFKAGYPRRIGRKGPHGAKWVIGSRYLQGIVLKKKEFPRRLLVQVLRVGPSVLVGLPFEITTESGRRIASAVQGAVADQAVERVVVCSLVNDFWGYVATEEEYGRQFYEGGHTLYGPNTQRFLAAQAAAVARETVGHDLFVDLEDRTWTLKVRRFLPFPPDGPAPDRRFAGKAAFTDPTASDDGYWEQTWVDVAPGGLHWHEPIVRVEQSDDDGATWAPAAPGGRPADDQGWSIEITHVGGPDAGRHTYRVRWHEPAHRFGTRHRFVLAANNGRPQVEGDPFD